MCENKFLKEYVHPQPIEVGKEKAVFKVEKQEYVPYLERVLPLSYESLYRQLKDLPIAIPHIEEIGKEKDQLVVIEEYISGPTLSQYMQAHDLTSAEIHEIMIQLLKILDVLHHQKPPIIHRDIKPENIFYDGQRLVLADFDIARNPHNEKNHDTTVLGTIGYAAPEQFGLAPSTPATDLYACGVLLNVLYTKKMPSVEMFQGDEKRIIQKATNINPEDRYQDAQAFMDALQHVHEKSYALPGFRSGNKTHMIIAVIGYVVIGYVAFAIRKDSEPITEQFFIVVAVFLILLLGVLFLFNYRNIQDHCLGHRSHSVVRIIGIILTYLFVSALIFMIAALMSGVGS